MDDEGKLTRCVGVCHDITDRWLAEEQVRRLNVELEQRVSSARARSRARCDLEQFNAMVSHDLRAPLSVVQMTCDLIRLSVGSGLPPSWAST